MVRTLSSSSSYCLLFCVASVMADVRFSSKAGNGFQYRQDNVPANTDVNGNPLTDEPNVGTLPYRVPATFGYDALENQKDNNNDNFLRSNIDNEANQRNTDDEPAQDMLPCRQPDGSTQQAVLWQRGETVQFPIRWNNPHDSDCEFNLWNKNMTMVAPLRRPFPCGAGYQNERFELTIPMDVPGCATQEDGCTLQFYAHSVETRTYAVCVNMMLTDAPVPAGTNPTAIPVVGSINTAATVAPVVAAAYDTTTSASTRYNRRRLQNATLAETNGLYGSLTTTLWQPAVHYWDSFDTSHVDSDYSVYRGQQQAFIRDELAAAIELRSYINNGGLIPVDDDDLQDARDDMRDEVEDAIQDAEQKAIQANKAAQDALDDEGNGECFEGDIYGVVNNDNCNRQYTNTYVTNVGYRDLVNDFLPKFQDAGLTPYQAKLKDTPFDTPADPIGQYKVNGKPSQEPDQRRKRRNLRD